MITGKRIKREDGSAADAAGDARRHALLAAMNEGEDQQYSAAMGRGEGSSRESKLSALAAEARADPAMMMQLMKQSKSMTNLEKGLRRTGILVY